MKQAMIDYTKKPKGDEFFTPIYAIKPLLKYLKPNSTIWCPFDAADSNYVKVLEANGHKVIATTLTFTHEENCPNIGKQYPFPKESKCLERCIKEYDFLDYKHNGDLFRKNSFGYTTRYFINNDCINYIISNPPYSTKNKVLKQLYELGIPFAMLMPLTTQETTYRHNLFNKYGSQILVCDIRINFIKNSSSNWFNTSYFGWKIFPLDYNRVYLNKKDNNLLDNTN